MKNEYVIGALVVVLLVLGVMYQGRGEQIEEFRAELTDSRQEIRLAQGDASDTAVRLEACRRVVLRGRRLIEAQARRIYRLYDDEMPALAREAFDLGSVGDEDELFFGTIRRLDMLRQVELIAGQDLRYYGWAPSTSLAEGDTNLAAICLGLDEQSLYG